MLCASVEPVSDPPDGREGKGFSELLAKLADVDVDGALVAYPVRAPHPVQKLSATQCQASIPCEECEQVELARSQHNRLTVNSGFSPGEVDLAASNFEHRRQVLSWRLGAPEYGLDAGDEFAGREWLRHVVIRTHLQTQDAVDLSIPRRQHDDRDVANRPELPAHVESVQGSGQPHIQDHQLGVPVANEPQAGFPIGGLVDAVATLAQVHVHKISDVGIILHEHHDGFLGHGSSPGFTRPCSRRAWSWLWTVGKIPGTWLYDSRVTHYQALGVSRSAQTAEIRRAYLRLARLHHPDANAGRSSSQQTAAERDMRRINEAWMVLGDRARRRAYDAELARSASRPRRKVPPPEGMANPDFVPFDTSDGHDPELTEQGPSVDGAYVPRWLQLLGPSLLVVSAASGCVGLVTAFRPLVSIAVIALSCSVVAFVAAPLVATAHSARSDRDRVQP